MHSDLTIPRDTGSIATYSCSTGYELVGNLMRTCTASGWSGSDPGCTGISYVQFYLVEWVDKSSD